MGKIIKYLLGGIVVFCVVALFIDDKEEEENEENPAVVIDGNSPLEDINHTQGNPYDDSKDDLSASGWGDGTICKIKTKGEYKENIIDYTKSNAKYNGDGPCVVDFYATWCGPCKALAPELEKMAKRFKGKVQFYKVDVDENNELASAYGIQSIPTLVMFNKSGKSKVITGVPYDLEAVVQELAE